MTGKKVNYDIVESYTWDGYNRFSLCLWMDNEEI